MRPKWARLVYVLYLLALAALCALARDVVPGTMQRMPGLEHCRVDGVEAPKGLARSVAEAVVPDVVKNATEQAAGALGAVADAVNGNRSPPPSPPPPPPPPHGRGALETCAGKEAVLRISFSGFAFFALLVLAVAGVDSAESPRMPLLTSFFSVKTLLFATLVVVPLVVPNGDFLWFGEFARVISGIFLLLQMVVLLDIIFLVNASWLENEWTALMVALTLAFYAAGFSIVGVLYHTFAPEATCSTSIGLLTLQLIFGVGVTALSIGWQERRTEAGVQAGLLTSGAVFFYTTVLVGSALRSMPESDGCFPEHLSDGPAWSNALAFCFAVLAVIWTAFRTGSNAKAMGFGGRDVESGGGGGDGWELDYRPDFFLLYFAMASAYLAMLFNGWSLSGTVKSGSVEADGGWTSVWVKGAASWACWLLYAWTLSAPLLFPDRDFS